MKKQLLVIFLFLCGAKASALPLGNPAAPGFYSHGLYAVTHPIMENFSYRVGYMQDHVYNRYVEFDSAPHTDIHRLALSTYAGEIVFNACEWLDVFATLGTSSLFMNRYEKYLDIITESSTPLILETASSFSWGIGGRGVLWSWGPFQFGIEGEYFSTKMPISLAYIELGFNISYPEAQQVSYQEWQIGGGVSLEIPIGCNLLAAPYIGLIGGHTAIDFGNLDQTFAGFSLGTAFSETFPDLESQKNLGYAIGVTLIGCSRLSLGIEGRFASEKAFNFNSSCRF